MTHCFLLDKAGCHAKQRLSFHKPAQTAPPERECAQFLAWQMREELTSQKEEGSKGKAWGRTRGVNEVWVPRESLGKEARAKDPQTREEPYSKVRPHKATSKSCSTRTSSSLKFYSGLGVTGILNVGIPTVPALLMVGLAPFSAHNLFPPKGTYCWDEGRLSVLRSCLLCLSRRIECTAFRKSFRLSGELWKEDLHMLEKQCLTHGELLTLSSAAKQIPQRTRG